MTAAQLRVYLDLRSEDAIRVRIGDQADYGWKLKGRWVTRTLHNLAVLGAVQIRGDRARRAPPVGRA